MNAYEMDDHPVYYAAHTAEEARKLYQNDTGETLEDKYPRQVTDAELDAETLVIYEDEEPTGEVTSMRKMLADQKAPGFLCCAP